VLTAYGNCKFISVETLWLLWFIKGFFKPKVLATDQSLDMLTARRIYHSRIDDKN
jgi:hypothetical protein